MEGYGHFEFWKREYIHFDIIRDLIHKLGGKWVGLEETPGGIGGPLEEYRLPDGLQLVIKDSTRGTYYHRTCEDCRYYPCQDAIISVRVTHDGQLKRCLIRNDNLVSLLQKLRNGVVVGCLTLVLEVFNLITNSTYYPRKWSPEILIASVENRKKTKDI